MAKNFADIYNSQNDGIALEQSLFLKEETTRGVVALPGTADRLLSLSGSSVSHSQPVISSPHKSGRHNNSVIKEKTSTEWSIPLFFNIDTALGAASVNEIDGPVRVLYKALFGFEGTAPNLFYNTSKAPDTTFTLFENLDVLAQQTPGCFVEAGSFSMPGDGQAQVDFNGMAKTALTVGMGLTQVDNDAGNTVTVAVGEGKRFPVGAKVMLVEADGVTRSADTPDGTARTVVSVAGDVVTVDGAVLADADGSGADIYLTYYEPVGPYTVIDNPQTGLEGTISIASLGTLGCVRSATFALSNSHEPIDYCYGEAGLGGALFTAGGRFATEITLEMNVNKVLSGFLNKLKDFQGEAVTLKLGNTAGRHMQIVIPRAIFAIPAIAVPESGTIPISITGNAYQTTLDAADEIELSFL